MKALKMDEKKKYDKSIEILKKYDDFIKKNKLKFPDYYILLGESYARLGKYSDAEREFQIAIEILNITNYLNQDEKCYLKKYIYQWLKYLTLKYNNTLAVKKYNENMGAQTYNIEHVRGSFQINFIIE